MGYQEQALPEQHKTVAIPLFHNKTHEPGVEKDFTTALVRQFAKSQAAQVVPRSSASVFLEGSIQKVQYKPVSFRDFFDSNRDRRSLSSSYDVIVHLNLKLIRKKDGKIIWERTLKEESSYRAPQIGIQEINSANALYNHQARLKSLRNIAEMMMVRAHDLMVEEF